MMAHKIIQNKMNGEKSSAPFQVFLAGAIVKKHYFTCKVTMQLAQ